MHAFISMGILIRNNDLSPTQVVGNQNLVDGLLWIGKIDVDVTGGHKVDPPAGYIPHPKNNNFN
jgi:hypothetical protein